MASEIPSSDLDLPLDRRPYTLQSLHEREQALRPDAASPSGCTIHPQHMSLRSLEEYFRAKNDDHDDPWAA